MHGDFTYTNPSQTSALLELSNIAGAMDGAAQLRTVFVSYYCFGCNAFFDPANHGFWKFQVVNAWNYDGHILFS